MDICVNHTHSLVHTNKTFGVNTQKLPHDFQGLPESDTELGLALHLIANMCSYQYHQ